MNLRRGFIAAGIMAAVLAIVGTMLALAELVVIVGEHSVLGAWVLGIFEVLAFFFVLGSVCE